MLDHISIAVRDVEASRKFYGAALAPLGVKIAMSFAGAVGMGRGDSPQFWFRQAATPTTPLHLAFAARNRAEVDAFYAAALAAGARDNGARACARTTIRTITGRLQSTPTDTI